jgi:hypothetical protein
MGERIVKVRSLFIRPFFRGIAGNRKRTDPDRHANRIMETLKQDLYLTELPVHIECFDNSNIQGGRILWLPASFLRMRGHPKTITGISI